MTRRPLFRRSFRVTDFQPDPDRDVEEEIAFHIAQKKEELVARGLDPEEAERRAREQFGDAERIGRECYDASRTRAHRRMRSLFFQDLGGDLRFGWRTVMRRPLLSAVAIATIAVGIGITAVMFSIVNGTMFQTLPFPESDRLLDVEFAVPEGGTEPRTLQLGDYWWLQERQGVFEGLEAFDWASWALSGDGGNAAVCQGAVVTTGAFAALRVTPARGRLFTPEDSRPESPPVMLISDRFWRSRYESDPGIVGRTVRLDGTTRTIVGVMPPGFVFPVNEDIWLPLAARDPELAPGQGGTVEAFGRLKEGTTFEAARVECEGLVERLAREFPEVHGDTRALVRPYEREYVGEEVRTVLIAMLIATLAVLLVACVNVANLQLTAALGRVREISIRTALGAGRRRIVRQFLVESFLLTAPGAVLGLLLTMVGMAAFNRAMPSEGTPFWFHFGVDLRVTAYVALLAVLTAVLAGILPALRSGRIDVREMLRGESQETSTPRAGRLTGRLVSVEVALSFALLVVAGLCGYSVLYIYHYQWDFEPRQILAAEIDLDGPRYDDPDFRDRVWERIRTEAAALPGAETACLVSAVPFDDQAARLPYRLEEEDPAAVRNRRPVTTVVVSTGSSATFRTPILQGRDFAATDRPDSPPVAMVTQHFAGRMFGEEGALGRRIGLSDGRGDWRWYEVVGVVPDINPQGFDPVESENVLLPLAQVRQRGLTIAVRARGDPYALTSGIRSVVSGIDPDVPVADVRTVQDQLKATLSVFTLLSTLFTIFGATALLLATVGLYGVVAFSVGRRTREIGIRMALGAARRDLVGSVSRPVVVQVTVGLVVGAILAFLLSQAVQAMLIVAHAFALTVTLATFGLLLLSVLVAVAVPLQRVLRIDPAVSLRTN
jgi:putative ABC transport system permease protein